MSSSYTDSELDSSEYTTATETETEDEVRGFKFIILVFLKSMIMKLMSKIIILTLVYFKLMTLLLWAIIYGLIAVKIEIRNFRV